MAFWFFMLSCALLVPAVMLLFGYIFRYHPPKQINSLYGYRTSMSSKNQDTWDFAHAVCGRLWWRMGWLILFASAAVMLPFLGRDTDTVGVVGTVLTLSQCAVLVATIFPVERALKREFDPQGRRRSPQ